MLTFLSYGRLIIHWRDCHPSYLVGIPGMVPPNFSTSKSAHAAANIIGSVQDEKI